MNDFKFVEEERPTWGVTWDYRHTITATFQGEDGTTIRCEISEDGKEIIWDGGISDAVKAIEIVLLTSLTSIKRYRDKMEKNPKTR